MSRDPGSSSVSFRYGTATDGKWLEDAIGLDEFTGWTATIECTTPRGDRVTKVTTLH